MTDATDAAEEAEIDSIEVQFVGPMSTLTKGRRKYEKGKVYTFDGRDGRPTADEGRELIENPNGRFREYRPREKRLPRSERRKLQITQGGRIKGVKKEEAELTAAEREAAEASKPKLPADGFKSKNEAIDFAKKHYGVDLDRSQNLRALNRAVLDAHAAKYPAAEPTGDDEDDGEFDTGAGYDPNAGEPAVTV